MEISIFHSIKKPTNLRQQFQPSTYRGRSLRFMSESDFVSVVHTGFHEILSTYFFQDLITKFREFISSGTHIIVSQYYITAKDNSYSYE